MIYQSTNEIETEKIAAEFSNTLKPGDIIAFKGSLGMGKTAFTRGIASGIGYRGRVTSPTFTIVNEYEGGRLPLFHFDMYRLTDSEDLFDIGWDDYLNRDGVCIVEWSERIDDILPPETIFITISRGSGDTERTINIERAE